MQRDFEFRVSKIEIKLKWMAQSEQDWQLVLQT